MASPVTFFGAPEFDGSAKRQILETVFLKLKLDEMSLCHEMTKPFGWLAEGFFFSH